MSVLTSVTNMEIEIDRRCPANCLHCMRGKTQNIYITPEIIEEVFNNKDHRIIEINRLLLTGGEVMMNKEGMIYLLNHLLNNVTIYQIHLLTNSLIYDDDIIALLQALYDKGVQAYMHSRIDQFHPKVPQKNIDKFNKLEFYRYIEDYLLSSETLLLGNAEANGLEGNEFFTKKKIENFEKIKNHVVIDYISDTVNIESLYVSARGNFGSKATDATWNMIDSKYRLDIFNDSLFKNCEFENNFMVPNYINQIKQGQLNITGTNFMNDYIKARSEGCLDIFLEAIDEDAIRDYLINSSDKDYTRKRQS